MELGRKYWKVPGAHIMHSLPSVRDSPATHLRTDGVKFTGASMKPTGLP